MKPKFKLGDRVKFTRVARRQMTMLAAENDPKPWWSVEWEPAVPRKLVSHLPAGVSPEGFGVFRFTQKQWSIPCGEQQGIYVGTRIKQNGLIVSTDPIEDLRRCNTFKRISSAPCGLVVTDARKNPILVLTEDLERV